VASRLDADRWQRIERVLDAALAADARSWPVLLERECGGDRELRSEVESLLRCADEARDFLESPPAAAAAALIADEHPSEPASRYVGRRIGAYRVLAELGRGGMSRVLLAERADGDFTQQVAIKLLRPGLDTEVDHARFRAERQILAKLSHPNIARLFDGGADDDGVPYFVLEHVDGQPIDVYADERKLTVAERITLFLTVCEATQYAHRNLIVHRDLKPTNILVTHDGVVKLLDFGLAKLLEASADVAPHRVSRTLQRWMTPEYAAPEQIRSDPVTTLTDVYQLGAVLHELLAGVPPFAQSAGDLRALEQAVLSEEPEAPSSVAARTGSAELAPRLRGDLDAILLKALRKEPEERYASVDALADDLRRHLTGHPVLAHRNTFGYRARRLVRRRRVETLAVLGVSLSLIAAVAFSLSQAHRARVQRDRADDASRASEAATSFLLHLFQASAPAEARGDTLTAETLVRRAAARVEELKGQPATQAKTLEVTAQLYRTLGRYRESYDALAQALGLRERIGQRDSLVTVSTLRQLGDALVMLGNSATADSMVQRALAIQVRILGAHDPATASTLAQLGDLAVTRGELAKGEAYYRQSLQVNQRVLGPADSATITGHLSLGAILQRTGRLAEAEQEYRRAVAEYEAALGPNHVQVAQAVLHLAYLIDQDPGRYAQAESLYRRGIEIRRRGFGDGHPMTAMAIYDLADFYSRAGNHAAALPLARQSVGITIKAYGAEHPISVVATQQLAGMLFRARQFAEAESLFRRVIALRRRERGDDDPSISGPEAELARVLIERRELREAEALAKDAVRLRRRASGPDHPLTARMEALGGMVLTRTGNYALADSMLQHARHSLEGKVSRQHPDLRELYGWLADLAEARGLTKEAASYRAIATAR
jgi:serine/threonine-protein kinase